MGKSRLYRNGAHGNEEEENKKKMKKGKNIDDRDPEPLSSKGKKREKERADFKQILADKGEEMYMKMKQRGKGVDNGENHETLADMKRKLEKKGVACLGSHGILSQPNEAEAEQKFVVPESARHITMRELGYLWRSSKSRFSRIIASCANEEERMEKRPKNIKLEWWKTFVRKRLSKEFQKEESSILRSRADVWEKAHTKKNGEPA
ncbi:hypothetical protein IFM89_009341 [Coptis chinensis]|uniref:Uncharacterized protein n=1 Tax=Coptis chinensis TaxID=261450 RepID=A0A835HK44_9MAGN|nr:hypothetical protein IFM89_009341 [Coptis chinensis]